MDDAKRIVVLEMLVTGVLADGRTTPEEIERFNEVVGGLPWGMERPVLEAVIKGTQERVAALTTPDAISDFVIGLAARMPDAKMREKLLFTMMLVMSADGEVHQQEKNILGMFVLAFGITSDRLASIKMAVAAQHARPA